MSARRTCSALKIDRALYVYKSKRGAQTNLKHKIKEICETCVRYGYRRVHPAATGWLSGKSAAYLSSLRTYAPIFSILYGA